LSIITLTQPRLKRSIPAIAVDIIARRVVSSTPGDADDAEGDASTAGRLEATGEDMMRWCCNSTLSRAYY